MISDLSPGDKLSLKGKIFELQKKLQIIDIRNKQKEEFSYKPTLYNYNLPDRHNNVLESINKAEIIRKQKKEMLEAAMLLQSEEGCTFAPEITRKSKAMMKYENRPVHLRLTDKGKHYAESIDQLREKVKNYDNDGRKLFTPTINKEPHREREREREREKSHSDETIVSQRLTSSQPPTPLGDFSLDETHMDADFMQPEKLVPPSPSVCLSSAAADEFLYQDARDREERHRIRKKEIQAEAEARAGASKMNASSMTLLRRKADREARLAFRTLAGLGSDCCEEMSAAAAVSYRLGIDDIQRSTRSVYCAEKWTTELLSRHISSVWARLDLHQQGSISLPDFLLAAVPLLLHTSLANASQEFQSQTHHHCSYSGDCHVPNALTVATSSELSELQSFLKAVVVMANKVEASKQGDSVAFQPHIYKHSYKLALRKQRKEREQIEEVLAMNKARFLLSPRNADTTADAGQDDTVASLENGEDRDLTVAVDQEEQSIQGSAITAESELSHHDIMYARALLKQKNLKRIAEEVEAKQMKECTFHPKVIPAMTHIFTRNVKEYTDPPQANSSVDISSKTKDLTSELDSMEDLSLNSPRTSSRGNSPSNSERKERVHNRLYNLKDKIKSSKLAGPSEKMIEEMQACTFAPQMQSSFHHRPKASVPSFAPPTEKAQQELMRSVQRIRAVHLMKVQRAQEESHEAQQERLNKSYARSREIARKGVLPFKFVLDERVEAKSAELSPAKRRTNPDLIVDVKLSSSKTAKIQIWLGDDPFELANSFVRIYSLDAKARDVLVNVIRQSMIDNGLLVASAERYECGEVGLNERSAELAAVDTLGYLYEDNGIRKDEVYMNTAQSQDSHFMDNEYDSQSSVSGSDDDDDTENSVESVEEDERSASGSEKGSDYLTA